MTVNRAARLQFAIHELIDILAEDITARVVTAIAKAETAKPASPPVRQPLINRSEPQPRRLLRRAQVSERTGLPKNTIYDHVKRGLFPAQIKIGCSVFWLESDVEGWIEKHIPAGG
ncbi:AlpA family phage regulatory protein [Stenotrophomonas sp. ISL-67]|uniref:helix-turn-helix transcriptional regulator n=1 Tax=Stenotrophomonas sp. ISL-67 TaxID=2819171 RepID=UPI001BE9FF69|nr:AlpA family phage regulatory protein [Stenotrophomonas sp. ISL-67]MBT2766134.1 AlpA family phage regulatory protein [Stenotrophomonas sp. ISL-67]